MCTCKNIAFAVQYSFKAKLSSKVLVKVVLLLVDYGCCVTEYGSTHREGVRKQRLKKKNELLKEMLICCFQFHVLRFVIPLNIVNPVINQDVNDCSISQYLLRGMENQNWFSFQN